MKDKDNRGRPLITEKGNQRRRNITVDDCTYQSIKKIGEGNFSAGIRALYEAYNTIAKISSIEVG